MTKAATTRLMILQKAADLIYKRGYQATSVDDIIAVTNVTKGAFFYHFKSKDDMGVAMVNEVVRPAMRHFFLEPLRKAKDPVQTILRVMKQLLLESPLQVNYGCPAGNLADEMASWNAGFNRALSGLTDELQEVLAELIQKGKESGEIRKTVNGRQVAKFIMAGYWGIRIIGKVEKNNEGYKVYLKELRAYLKGLK